jgi:hypothetical protein
MEIAHLDMRTGQVARLARMRLTIGLLQGLALSGLLATPGAGAWPALPPYVFPLLLMGALFLPVLWQSGIGSLTGRQMGRWSCMALLLIVLLVALNAWRLPDPAAATQEEHAAFFIQTRFGLLLTACGLILYISHALVLAGARDRRWIASYASYFTCAWTLVIQLLLSLLAVVAVALLVGLGVTPHAPWLLPPACALAFAGVMHWCSTHPRLPDAIRTGLLRALSCMLPAAVLLTPLLFLLVPQWLGSTPSRDPYMVAGLLALLISPVLVMLINAAFGQCDAGARVALPVRVSARAAALMLPPLVAFGWHGLLLRLQTSGWSGEKLFDAGLLLVLGWHALGYAWPAMRRRQWQSAIPAVNRSGACLFLVTLVLLLSPLADAAA